MNEMFRTVPNPLSRRRQVCLGISYEIEESSSTPNCMMEFTGTLEVLKMLLKEPCSLSMARHRIDCTSVADMSTAVLEMLSIEFHSLSMAHHGIECTNAADMSTQGLEMLSSKSHTLGGTLST
jgi:hypothetical protein